jgi:uncharacterized RDD family membrane protein YckC
VAARYAKAPSFSEMLAEEARGAVRAAEAASRAALEAQAAAESVLAGLEAASASEQFCATEAVENGAPGRVIEMAREASVQTARPIVNEEIEGESPETQSFGIRWDEDLPARSPEPEALRVSLGPSVLETPVESSWDADAFAYEAIDAESIQVVEPSPATHANLIEFPRELVATRKIRPRRAEGRYAIGPPAGQLSIFEVDPESISTVPEAPAPVSEAEAPAWRAPEWSGIELDAEPALNRAFDAAVAPATSTLELAPFGLRLMAATVDGALITGAFLVAALMVAGHVKAVPSMKGLEVVAALALAAIAMLYQALFFTLAQATPGMRYARISLCTFDDEIPTRAQLRSRVIALLVSLLPMGLGIVWAIFDEEHLSWHDRLSRTYQRRC